MITLNARLQLVPVSAQQADQMHPLMTACYPPVYAHLWEDGANWYLRETYNAKRVRQDLQKPASPYYWVHWDGEAVGILWLHEEECSPDFPDQPALKLQRIYLHPKVHGNGIGKAVVEYVVGQAEKLNKQIVWLEAMDTQESAHQFYEKVGFRKSGTFRLTFERMHPHYRGMVRMTRSV
ncbi:MAG: GNAT family N-acetyltransferase [Bacteroidota bacterium]